MAVIATKDEPKPAKPMPDLLPPTASPEEKIQRLVLALSRVQGAMEAASKDATNPHFKSKYATLASVWKAARKHLRDNGFAVVQLTVPGEGGSVMLHTILYHCDGANIDSFYPVVYGPCAAPALGAALKYARRYSLEAMIGATTDEDPEDDDGDKAPVPAPRQAPKPSNAPSAPAAPAQPPLKDQATAFITKVDAAKTWEQFMEAVADAGDLLERVRLADKTGKWVARINDIVAERRLSLEPPGDAPPEGGAA